MALMEAGSATGEVARPSLGEQLAYVSDIAIATAALSDAEIQTRLDEIATREKQITGVIDFHEGRPASTNDPGLHYGLTAAGAVVDPLSSPKIAS